jgi:hypothetical protein
MPHLPPSPIVSVPLCSSHPLHLSPEERGGGSRTGVSCPPLPAPRPLSCTLRYPYRSHRRESVSMSARGRRQCHHRSCTAPAQCPALARIAHVTSFPRATVVSDACDPALDRPASLNGRRSRGDTSTSSARVAGFSHWKREAFPRTASACSANEERRRRMMQPACGLLLRAW